MRDNAGDVPHRGAAAFERQQPIFSVLQHAVRGGEHEIGRDRDPAAEMVPAHDEHDVTRDGLIGRLRSPDHGGGGRSREHEADENGGRSQQVATSGGRGDRKGQQAARRGGESRQNQ
jgi:hypothetical protein